MVRSLTLELPALPLDLPYFGGPHGTRVLHGILDLAQAVIERLKERSSSNRVAAVTRLRGTGRRSTGGPAMAAPVHHPPCILLPGCTRSHRLDRTRG